MPPVDPEPNDEEKREKLDQDYEPPFSPPADINDPAPTDHPQDDTGLQREEIYNAGTSAAAGVTDPAIPKSTSDDTSSTAVQDSEGFDIEPTADEV